MDKKLIHSFPCSCASSTAPEGNQELLEFGSVVADNKWSISKTYLRASNKSQIKHNLCAVISFHYGKTINTPLKKYSQKIHASSHLLQQQTSLHHPVSAVGIVPVGIGAMSNWGKRAQKSWAFYLGESSFLGCLCIGHQTRTAIGACGSLFERITDSVYIWRGKRWEEHRR